MTEDEIMRRARKAARPFFSSLEVEAMLAGKIDGHASVQAAAAALRDMANPIEPPVDPDLLEARTVVADYVLTDRTDPLGTERGRVRIGLRDEDERVASALAGIRHGRVLQAKWQNEKLARANQCRPVPFTVPDSVGEKMTADERLHAMAQRLGQRQTGIEGQP